MARRLASQRQRWRSGLIAIGFLLWAAAGASSDGGKPADRLLEALGRSLGWLEAHEPDADNARLGDICLDAWAWYLFATLHPDAAVRSRAGTQLDRRLRTLKPPSDDTTVELSYWAVLVRLLNRRGIDAAPYRTALAGFDINAVLQTATPTTRWWTAELFRRSGIPVQPDFTSTFIATASASAGAAYTPTRRDAYRIFHELVPATDLGHEPLTQLTPGQDTFARGVTPGLLAVSKAEGDTDAVAEALVSVALLGDRDTPGYRDGIAWLLTRQRADGTYVSDRDRTRSASPDNFRHVVLVASWAVLTSLPQ